MPKDLPQTSQYPLEPDAETMRGWLEETTERIVDYVATLPSLPASDLEGSAEVASLARQDWPDEPSPLSDLLDVLFERLAPTSFNHPGPGFMGFIPGGGLFHSALADLISGTINRYITIWAAAPGLVQLETNVIRWFCSIIGYPTSSGGYLSSGGSMANFSALVTARKEHLPENFLSGTLYISEQTHHCLGKAALMAGFPQDRVRTIATDDLFRMRLDLLEVQIRRDREDGLEPFLLVGNGGSTNTGAVDPLPEMADLAARHNLWFHVDAAYGGFFALTERGHQRLRGIDRADSVALDPHKGLFLHYGTGCLLVKDLNKLRRAHSVGADYMPPIQDDPDRLDFSEISPELSRAFRGLRVWLPFQLVGVEPFRAALDEKLDQAEWASEQLKTLDGVEVVAEPQLSTLAFRLRRDELDVEAQDDLNQRFLKAINDKQRVFLTGTKLHGRFVLRISVLNYRTHQDRMEMCLEDIRQAAAEVTEARQPT